jgi:cell division protein ZapA
MVVLWYATQQKAAGNQPLIDHETEQQLSAMEKMLDKILSSEA